MLPLYGMLFQMRLMLRSLKPTCTSKHTHFCLDHPLVLSVVLNPSSVSGYRNLVDCFFALLHHRVLLNGEIKRYKSPIRISDRCYVIAGFCLFVYYGKVTPFSVVVSVCICIPLYHLIFMAQKRETLLPGWFALKTEPPNPLLDFPTY